MAPFEASSLPPQPLQKDNLSNSFSRRTADLAPDAGQLRNRFRSGALVDEQQPPTESISISTHSRHAEDAVMPFLTEHMPLQMQSRSGSIASVHSHRHVPPEYAPQEQHPQLLHQQHRPPTSTRFCYRHEPGTKCRRQANEPGMDQLQNELASLSHSDQQAISHVWSLFSAAPAKQRELMLQGLLTQCCFPQLSYISASVRDLIKIDFLSALPAELGFKILRHLDTISLCKAAQVSQRWRSLADDDVVWHRMCEQHIVRTCHKCGWGLPLLEKKRLRIEKRQIQLRATGRGINEWSPATTSLPAEDLPPLSGSTDTLSTASAGALSPGKRALDEHEESPGSTKRPRDCTENGLGRTEKFAERLRRPWKDVYKDRFKVGTAWKYGRFSTRVFRGHTNGVMCLQFDDNVLISGSYDSTVKVWDVNTCEEIRTLRGHASGIQCLQFDNKKLMTGSLDGKIKLWNWKTGQCLRTFNAHEASIPTLHFVDRYVASGSMDRTIRVWDSETKQTFLLRGHTDCINCVRVDEASRTLFSASDDLTIRLWDLDRKRCIKVFEGHVGQVQQVQLLPVEFELEDRRTAGDKDDDVSSVHSAASSQREVDSPAPVETYWPDEPDRPAPPRYMLTCALDSTIRLWDVHFSAEKTQNNAGLISGRRSLTPESVSQNSQPSAVGVLPTDPLTNSHVPRAAACVRTFFGHVEGIWALAADHLRMISGSEDKMLKVWDPRTGKCERTFTGHAGPVTCAWLTDSKIASGSDDCEVRMICFGEA